MKRQALIDYLDELLDARGVKDYGPNGLQVEGAQDIEHVVCGVTASLELIEAAAARGAQALLVHHGILWGGTPTITGSFGRRVKALLDSNINLLAYHLPLDRHMEVGNGARAAARLGLTDLAPFGQHKGITVGVRGRVDTGTTIEALSERAGAALGGSHVTTFPFGPARIETVGIVTGGADKDLPQAVAAGLDCYITGEVSEYVMHYAKEEGIHFIAAGHHATERWGVQALAERMAADNGLTWEFIDIPNPA